MNKGTGNATASLGDYRVFSGTGDDIVKQVIDGLDNADNVRTLACMNPHSYVVALNDPPFRNSLMASDWLLPDGVGILWASKWLGTGLQRRLTGPDMFETINAAANSRPGTRVLLVGGPAETVDLVGRKLKSEFPSLEIVGCLVPRVTSDFNATDVALIAETANMARAEIIWLGLGAPKQEKLAHRLATAVDAKFVGCVGAAFDFYSGRVKRSSPVMRALGLEWLPRLIRNPGRLWRRTFVSAPIFLAQVILISMKNFLQAGGAGLGPSR